MNNIMLVMTVFVKPKSECLQFIYPAKFFDLAVSSRFVQWFNCTNMHMINSIAWRVKMNTDNRACVITDTWNVLTNAVF